MNNLDELENLGDFEKAALDCKLSPKIIWYFSAAAGSNQKHQENQRAFRRYWIVPRVLRDVSCVDFATTLLGCPVSSPIGISPVAKRKMAHPEGDVALAAASAKEGCLMIFSSGSLDNITEVAKIADQQPVWFQLYIFNDRSVTSNLVKQAESNGCSALVVTVDSPIAGQWTKKMPPGLIEKFTSISRLPKLERDLLDPSLTFKDLKWLKSMTKLPIVAKGIMSGEDAVEALQNGASAILVSNHGGRQIDGVCPTIDVLKEVVDAVKMVDSTAEVYMDGGIRSGLDVFKALALGAKAVFVGRPSIWGLAVGGEAGVRKVLQILKNELRSTMQLSGASSLSNIDEKMVKERRLCCNF